MKFALLLIPLLVLAACGNKAPSSPSAAQPASREDQSASPAPDPASPAPKARSAAESATPAPAESEPLIGSVHGFMTQQLRIFVEQKGRMPRDFSEFASARMDSVPRPPEGTRYAIDPATVEVKVVRK